MDGNLTISANTKKPTVLAMVPHSVGRMQQQPDNQPQLTHPLQSAFMKRNLRLMLVVVVTPWNVMGILNLAR